MRTRIVVFAVVMTVVSAAVPGFAHHSAAVFASEKRIQLKDATVVSYAWRNPHGVLVVDVKGQSGVIRWTLETGSPSSLGAEGWTRNSVAPGDVITVDVSPARNGTPFGRMNKVTKADGTVLTTGTSERNTAR